MTPDYIIAPREFGRAPGHDHNCKAGHRFNTADPATHYETRKGNPRYLCPRCAAAPGFRLPAGWRKAT